VIWVIGRDWDDLHHRPWKKRSAQQQAALLVRLTLAGIFPGGAVVFGTWKQLPGFLRETPGPSQE
jgi:hypothetical protein